jgi:tetratricopeptide (TPR) repeat protein
MIQTALVQKAINAALQSEWQAAVDLNLQILEQDPQNLDSLNRLARAYLELGDIAKSKKLYKEVITIDPYNVIALRNLKRFQLIKGDAKTVTAKISKSGPNRSTTTFIEEPGKTKVIQLVRPATPSTLFTLHSGEKLKLAAKGRGIQVVSEGDSYVGRLPDDLAFQMQHMMKDGNQYDVFVKQVMTSSIYVFIKEIVRAEKYANRPSFSLSSENYVAAQEVSVSEEQAESFEDDEDVQEE